VADVDELLNKPAPVAPIKRDQYGRYLIPDPDTGKQRAWTRATTLAGTLADRFGLEQWSKRNVVLGLGARTDLYAQAASCTPDDRDTLNQIITQAEEASKGKAGANLGTALHRFTERIDAGETIQPPAPWDADVNAYRTAMGAHGVTVLPAWIERVLIIPQLGVAGTCDRLCTAPEWVLPRIGDLKTGKDVLRYSMPEIAIQLSLYAHATHWFDPATGVLQEIDLSIDQECALVMHLPVGRGACTLYEVDIAAGWTMAQVAAEVREWRKRKNLAGQLEPATITTGNPQDRQTPSGSPGKDPSRESGDQPAEGSSGAANPLEGTPSAGPAPELLAPRVDWLRARIAALTPTAKVEAGRMWPDNTPRKADHITDHDQIDRISRCLWAVETAHGLSFPDPDPADAAPPPLPAIEEKPQPKPPIEAIEWADKGKALLALLDDEPLAHACAQVAGCTDVPMTQLRYEALQAVVTQIGDPAGAIRAAWHGPQPDIDVVPQAEQIMALGAAQAAGAPAATKRIGLTAARNAARTHGLPAPKSLTEAASSPLLAALVASGTNTNNPQETT
jgi:hypothetical protein